MSIIGEISPPAERLRAFHLAVWIGDVFNRRRRPVLKLDASGKSPAYTHHRKN
jgi:hypothetical protein